MPLYYKHGCWLRLLTRSMLASKDKSNLEKRVMFFYWSILFFRQELCISAQNLWLDIIISARGIKQTSPYLFTQITYGTTTVQKIIPEIWLAQNTWISVFFQLSLICSRYCFCGLYTHFLNINSSLFPLKNCNEVTLLFSARALQLWCAALKCRWDSIASVLKLHRLPPTATPVRC